MFHTHEIAIFGRNTPTSVKREAAVLSSSSLLLQGGRNIYIISPSSITQEAAAQAPITPAVCLLFHILSTTCCQSISMPLK